ncbi:MAG: hypothetical protein H6622_17110 [Halobacteriovoraceae bacterium]|nr:hypothetical protein [Halobacteriovoraceae bacterium]
MDTLKKIKNKQYLILASIVGGLFVVVILGLWISDPNSGKREISDSDIDQEELKKIYNIDSNTVVSEEEKWVAKSEKKFFDLKKSNNELEDKIKKLTEKLQKVEEEAKKEKQSDLSPELPSMSSPLPSFSKTKSDIGAQVHNDVVNTVYSAPQKVKAEEEKIISISLEDTKEGEKKKNIESYIPSGSFAKVVLLSGLDAPTGGLATKNPMPVVMKLSNDGQLPNRFKSNIRECQLTGAGYGDISSERGFIRLEKLSCVTHEGNVIEVKVKGYVTGEDGKPGFRGKLVSKQGQMIAKAALAGTFAGLGNAVNQSYQTISSSALGSVQTLDPKKTMQSGLTGGASSALNKIADYYIARANETYPIIEISAGRTGEMVLSDGVELGENVINIGEKL